MPKPMPGARFSYWHVCLTNARGQARWVPVSRIMTPGCWDAAARRRRDGDDDDQGDSGNDVVAHHDHDDAGCVVVVVRGRRFHVKDDTQVEDKCRRAHGRDHALESTGRGKRSKAQGPSFECPRV